MKTKIIYVLIVCAITLTYSALAQVELQPDMRDFDKLEQTASFAGFNFFSALICGLVIALALNLVFTNLAVAAGISIIKPEEKIRPGHFRHRHTETREEETTAASTIKKINNAFGAWMLFITSVCLFFACWLAIEISGADTIASGIIVALVIWGAFYLIMTSLEATVLSTALGGLYRTAASGLTGIGKGVKTIFEKSPEKEAADTAAKITAAVRDELFGNVRVHALRKELQSYIQQLKPPSAKDIKNEIASLLSGLEVHEYPEIDHIVTRFQEQSKNKQRAQTIGTQVKDAFNAFKQERQQGKDKVSAGVETAMRMAGKTSEEAQQKRQQLEEYLRKTDKKELQPEELKKRIETLFTRPREGFAQVKESIGSMDKNTTVALLETRKDMTHEEAERIADNIQRTIDGMKAILGTGTGKAAETRDRVEGKLRDYIASLDEPQLDYDAIKEDVRLLFHDPREGADALINRLKSIDRDTIKKIIASRRDMSEEQAEKIVSKIEETRDDVINKAHEMKTKVEQKVRDAQETAARVTEETRKNAAIAAWWAFGTAVVSGIAAVLGAYTAFNT